MQLPKRLFVLSPYRLRRTTLVACFCAAVLAGLGIGRVVSVSSIVIWISLAVWLVLVKLGSRGLLIVLIALGLSIGATRASDLTQKVAGYNGLFGKLITVQGSAVDDAVYGKQTQLVFDMQHISKDGAPLPGKLGIKGFGALAIFRNDTVTVTGKLSPGKGSYIGWISYGTLTVKHNAPSPVDAVRRKFNAGILSALPEPLGSFGLGLLIGQRNTLPQTVTDDLKHVGLTHIIAVSGYNLTIILLASQRFLGKRSKYQFTVMSLLLIGVFLLLAGGSPSIIRAAIVSVLSLAAWYYGRSFKPYVLILLAAAITGYANPLYVWSDAGWWLSFLAFFGVMIVSPLIGPWLVRSKRLRESIPVSVGLESVCAELMTIPYVLHTFGQVSLVGLLANVLVTALVPLGMLLALIAGLSGMLVPMVSGWFAWPALALLSYMLDVAHILARAPHVFLDNLFLSLAGMLGLYIIVLSITVILTHKTKLEQLKHDIITDEIARNNRANKKQPEQQLAKKVFV
jgi:competence protein ComEC